MKNILENAYFGKAYKTRDGRKKIYLAPCDGGEFHKLLGEDLNIEHFHKNGQYAELYPLPCDVVKEWQEPVDEENLLATRFGGSDKEWNKYLKLRKGDKVRFKKSAFEYKGHENDIYTMTSDGVFSMGGSLCGMFDGLSGAYGMCVFDVVEE